MLGFQLPILVLLDFDVLVFDLGVFSKFFKGIGLIIFLFKHVSVISFLECFVIASALELILVVVGCRQRLQLQIGALAQSGAHIFRFLILFLIFVDSVLFLHLYKFLDLLIT